MAREIRLKCKRGHLVITTGDPKKIARKAEKQLIVCNVCKPENVRLTIISEFAGKLFLCPNAHLTEVAVFANGYCNIALGDWFENVKIAPEELLKAVAAGKQKCHLCKGKISPIDDAILALPQLFGIKTKTRVGDIWDKARCPEPADTKTEIVDGIPTLTQTEFSKLNRRRIKELRRKHNKRLAKPAGEIIDRPTEKSYRDGKNKRPSKRDLNDT